MKQVESFERAFRLPPRELLDETKLAEYLKQLEKSIETRKVKLKMENKFNVDKLLVSRAKLRGDFSTVARAHVAIIEAIEDCATQELSHEERVALTMIAHKIARVITAQSYDEDSWKDIAGYATLVVNKFKENQNEA